MTIEHTFRERRIRLGMTQEDTARAAGVARKTLSDFETGRGRVSLNNLHRLLLSVGLELATKEATRRPTLDELSDRYQGQEPKRMRSRARRKA
ncbi:MAG: helix-turn-helix domain-containing protein [Burkholderiales bacterium]|nr:helix-turn-helix domain-containing protein [Burkholderiales bacterium]